MAKDKILTIALIVGAILVANSMGVINIGSLFSAASGPAAAAADQTGTLCLNDGAVMTVGPIEYRYAPTTSVSGLYHRVFIDGINRGLKSDGSTIDVTTPKRVGGNDGAAVEIYYAENATGFYAAKHAFSVPCVSAFSSSARPDSDAYKVIANQTSTSLSLSVFNFDDGLVNSCASGSVSAETVGANDATNLKLRINANGKRGFSPYGKMLLTFKYNNTAYTKLELSGANNPVVIATPTFRASNNASTGYTLKTYAVPGEDSLTTVVQDYNIYIESGSLDPVDSTTNASRIFITLDDEDYFLNSDTGKEELGAEDNTFSNVGVTQEISTGICIA